MLVDAVDGSLTAVKGCLDIHIWEPKPQATVLENRDLIGWRFIWQTI